MCLHEKIKALCEEKGISVYQMCNDTGIGQNTVSNWKNRPNTNPALPIAKKLSEYFSVPIDYFLKEGE